MQIKKSILNRLLFCLVVASLFLYFYYKRNELQAIHIFEPLWLFLCVPLYLVFFYLNARVWKCFLLTKNVNIGSKELIGVLAKSSLLNYTAPFQTGATGYRLYYFKSRYDISIVMFGKVAVGVALHSALGGLIAGAALVYLVSSHGYFGFLMAAVLYLVLFVVYSWACKRFLGLDNGWVAVFAAFCQQVSLIVSTLITFLAFKALGVDVGLIECAAISVLASLILLLSITPANLGFKEFVFGALGGFIAVAAHFMVAMSLVDRVVQASVHFMLLIAFRPDKTISMKEVSESGAHKE